ncbi:hypothetical protein [Polyangium sp. 15x6]|uniref:hypothetical protein n=1 Tax=Polyangium sp. 15x6 TaxID=3042687 RepID=UPI00249A5AE8|nr:hypothetical protein [Polyangium sp. 15x6]MDI3284888.1 hypothetical protein [Polyangium sp. 15x6]
MSKSAREGYEALLVELHREMRAGRRDGERAEAIAAPMDAFWYQLSEDEQTLFGELSEDLYLIEDKRRVVPLAEGETLASVMQVLATAFKANDARRTLELLRKKPTLEAPDVYAIGRCWSDLGFHLGAACFYDFANELSPKDNYDALTLDALVRAGALEEAMARAKTIEARPNVSARLAQEVVRVLQRRAAMSDDASERRSMHERVTTLVHRTWNDPAAQPAIRADILMAAGNSSEELGDKESALASFERAVAVHRSDETLMRRGIALVPVDRTRALWDFTEAVRMGTKRDWPYLYVALHAFIAGRFADAERSCEAGLALAERPELRGRLLELWAMAAAVLDRPPPFVSALFIEAQMELPLDPQLRSNAKRYLESLSEKRATSASDYQISTDIDELRPAA